MRSIKVLSTIKIASSFIPLRAMCVLCPRFLHLHRLTTIGQECTIGIVFPAEGDAKNFYKQVSNRKEIKRTSCPYSSRPLLTIATQRKVKTDSAPPKKKSIAKGGTIDKSLISAPTAGSFVHVAHMGYD